MQAIILAGGKGERLLPLTLDRSKCMVEIRGVPLLAYQLQWLLIQGVNDVIVACGYRHEAIQQFFGNGEKWKVRLRYSVESQPLGRGGALKLAFKLLETGEDACLAMNGDIITNFPVEPLIQTHRENSCLATVWLTRLTACGIAVVDGKGTVVAFHEKLSLPDPYWMNAGIYVLSREVEPLLPDQGEHESSTFPQLVRQRQLGACELRLYGWWHVTTATDIREVSEAINKGLIPLPRSL